jgi:hypothetical protein
MNASNAVRSSPKIQKRRRQASDVERGPLLFLRGLGRHHAVPWAEARQYRHDRGYPRRSPHLRRATGRQAWLAASAQLGIPEGTVFLCGAKVG